MKFLCVDCDEPMKMSQAAPPDDRGSLTALFACPACGRRIAMLTNPWETEVVQSLGVRIGPAEAPGDARRAEAAEGSGCPFAGVVQEMRSAAPDEVRWTPEAEARLANIPDFVRPMARQGVEHYARSNGHAVVDERVLDEARTKFGM